MDPSATPRSLVFLAASTIVLAAAGWVRAFVTPVAPPAVTDRGWPRELVDGDRTLTIYQPQVEKWDGVLLQARAAVAVQNKANPQPGYGVIWFEARTDVDKERRMVALSDFKLTKTTFPSQPAGDTSLPDYLTTQLPNSTREVSLDRLESSLAVTQAESAARALPLRNDPPRIIFSEKPAVLVLIDGKPALRDTQTPAIKRVINTRALVLFDTSSGTYYLFVRDRWLAAPAVEGPWAAASNPPASLDSIKQSLVSQNMVDLFNDPDAGGSTAAPVVYVSTTPAELIQIDGKPSFSPIDNTQLLQVTNTTGDMFMDVASQQYYVLISGRWFASKSLEGGWAFVPQDKLPRDFAKIPENHPKGDVLASVAGTPQAKETLIANSIPQTAEIKRNEARLSVSFDGAPQFKPIDGTQMQYAVNSQTPVVQISPQAYYAVQNGVWFTAASPAGPWTVATSIPSQIYTIPPSSPIHYVTYVQTYAATPEVVYVGYTPGYYGTCVAPGGTVVYGTGYYYPPYVGTVWCGYPYTYGCGAAFGWGAAAGCALGFGVGMAVGACCHPWWGPVGWNTWHGYGWGGYGHWGNVNFNNVNVYNHWGNNVVNNHWGNTNINNRIGNTNINNRIGNTNIDNRVGNRNLDNRAAQANRNNVLADRDGNVYRRNGDGSWDHNNAGNWQRQDAADAGRQNLDRDWQSRDRGEQRTQNYQQRGNFDRGGGGYRGGGGFRGGGGRR